MVLKISFPKNLLYRLLIVACLLYLAATLVFCVFYRLHGYDALRDWYLGMNDCFYRHEQWTAQFFTPATKASGDTFTVIGALLVIALGTYLWYRKEAYVEPELQTSATARKSSFGYSLLIIFLAYKTCKWASGLLAPTTDEVFSAVNCADLPAFQCLSYYMLPNNHILFNMLDHFIGSTDRVATGRLISELAYIGSLLYVFRWLKERTLSRVAALLILALVGLQFTTLGFGVLARGYSSHLFCGLAAISAYAEYIRTGARRYLRYNTVFNAIGFLLIPSYMFFYLAQVCYSLFAGHTRRFVYWKHQLILYCGVFLFYLPALCFSGAASLARNRYNMPETPDVASFLPTLWRACDGFSAYCFSIPDHYHFIAYILFFLPLSLFLFPGKESKAIALFYLLMWVVCIAGTALTRHSPIQRSVSIQFCVTMTCAAYAFYLLCVKALSFIRGYNIRSIAFLVIFYIPMLFCARYLYYYCQSDFFYLLYGYDITTMHRKTGDESSLLRPGSGVACSDESFYPYYIYRGKDFNVTHCPTGHEDYYIESYDDHAPKPAWIGDYEVILNDKSTEHIIYKRK